MNQCGPVYNSQHKQITTILQMHWYLLTQDSIILKFVTSLAQLFEPNHCGGTSKCGTCTYCKYLNINRKKCVPQKNCQLPHWIVYLMPCECGSFYIEKTIREF